MAQLTNTRISLLQYISKFTVEAGLYVETGFLKLVSTARCAADSFKPAILTYNLAIGQLMANDLLPMNGQGDIDTVGLQYTYDPFFGELIIDGTESKALGCSNTDKIASVTDPCGSVWQSSLPAFCPNPNGLRDRKLAQKMLPSSVFTGKLRLYVQSVYGSKRNDYSIPLSGTGGADLDGLNLTIGGYTLNHSNAGGTSVLYSTNHFRYFMLEVSAAQIVYYPLKLTPNGVIWADLLANHANNTDPYFVAKIEAYILADASVDKTTPRVLSTGLSTPGSTLYYGFKATRKGDKLRAILHESIPLQPEFNARDVAITLAESGAADAEVLSIMSATETVEKVWGHNTSFVPWVASVNSIDGFSYQQFGSFGATVNAGAIPLYGWYDALDVWQPVDLTLISRAFANGELLDDIQNGPMDLPLGASLPIPQCFVLNDTIGDRRRVNVSTTNVTGTQGSLTVSQDTITFNSVNGTTSANRLHERDFVGIVNTGEGSCNDTNICDPGAGGALTCSGVDIFTYLIANWNWENYITAAGFPEVHALPFPDNRVALATAYDSAIYENTDSFLAVGYTSKGTIIIPHNDCESVYYGRIATATAPNSPTFVLRRLPLRYISSLAVTKRILTGGPSEHVADEPLQGNLLSSFSSGVLDSGSIPSDSREDSTIKWAGSSIKGIHSTITSNQIVYQQAIDNGNVAWGDRIFYPVLGMKMSNGLWFSYSSYNGANKLNYFDGVTLADTKVDNGYPVDADTTVGWA